MQSFLSEQASQHLVDSIVNIAEKLVLEKVKQSRKRYLIQKEVMEEYNVTHKVITEWEMNGLRKVKIGKTIRYDRHDIENVIEQMKNWKRLQRVRSQTYYGGQYEKYFNHGFTRLFSTKHIGFSFSNSNIFLLCTNAARNWRVKKYGGI